MIIFRTLPPAPATCTAGSHRDGGSNTGSAAGPPRSLKTGNTMQIL